MRVGMAPHARRHGRQKRTGGKAGDRVKTDRRDAGPIEKNCVVTIPALRARVGMAGDSTAPQ
jgi:hypothetical protein